MSKSPEDGDNLSTEEKRALLTQLLRRKAGTFVPSPSTHAEADEATRYDPFPLTPIQQAYWLGRSPEFELGGVAAHLYQEFDARPGLDLGRLEAAWRVLVSRHDMLRAVFLPDATQRVLREEEAGDYSIRVNDLRAVGEAERERVLAETRSLMSHETAHPGRWPLFNIRASLLEDGRVRLHVGLDLLVADAWSIRLLLAEWLRLYGAGGDERAAGLAPLNFRFRDYVLAERARRGGASYARARQYWRSKIVGLPAGPSLPLARSPAAVGRPRFVRLEGRLGAEEWAGLKREATRAGVTPSAALLAAYAEVLGRWSGDGDFTINMTLFNREPLHADVNRVVGDFTAVTLLACGGRRRDEGFGGMARRLQARLWEDLEHRQVSGVEVLREWGRARAVASAAAMPVVFTSMLGRGHEARAAGAAGWELFGEWGYGVSQTPQVWIDHQVYEQDGRLFYNWDVVEGLLPDGVVGEMMATYQGMLGRLAAGVAAWAEPSGGRRGASDVLPSAVAEATRAELLDERVWGWAAATPSAPAVETSTQTINYKQLIERSLSVSKKLRQLGAERNKLVAVVMEKGWEQVVGVLGVLGSTAAYLPIEADTPEQRLHYLLEQGEVKFALTQSAVERRLRWPAGVERVVVDELPDEPAAEEGPEPERREQAEDDLAYVIFTSGSSGVPKGVMIEHRSAANTILDINERFHVGAEDKVLALSALNFDLSVYDIFGMLAAGATVVLPGPGEKREPAAWAEMIGRHGVTIWNSVPAVMEMLVEYARGKEGVRRKLQSLRLVLLSGDWIPVGLPAEIKRLVEGVKVVSLGGATEASIWSILHEIDEVKEGSTSIPYGRPMRNQRVYVLNERMEECPVWVKGQIYIAGQGVTRGYWKDEAKTRQSVSIEQSSGERMYRTGDMGRYMPNGEIEFLGREDTQVKISGHRIELGEIEGVLSGHNGVRAAVVQVAGEQRGSKRLVGYVAAEPWVNKEGLLKHAAERLPEYMVPSTIFVMPSLPLTPNGKVDRKKLAPLPPSDSQPPEGREAEPTGVTKQVSELVARVMELEQVSPDAELLSIGMSSLEMIRLAGLLEETFGFRPKLGDLFRLSTVRSVAEYYEEHRPGEAGGGARAGSAQDTQALLESFKLILDPHDRETFKNGQPGIRRFVEGATRVTLSLSGPRDGDVGGKFTTRRSHRMFAAQPVCSANFGDFLSCLRQFKAGGGTRYLYGSAGGLYPVQTYLHVKDGRVQGLTGGSYYYHPVEHYLAPLSPDVEVSRSCHALINRPAYDEAAFSIFLVAQLRAIAPIYQEKAKDFALIEAGLMTQLLETSAPACGIGLCQIGLLDFERIRGLFRLEDTHLFLHSLIGGGVEPERDARWSFLKDGPADPTAGAQEWEEGEL